MEFRRGEDNWVTIEDEGDWQKPTPDCESLFFPQSSYQTTIILPDGTYAELPRALYRLRVDIEEATQLSGLGDDWDQEGAKAVTPSTISRAARILITLARKLYEEANNTTLDSPQIAPYPDGGVTLYWRTKRLNVLVHIPPDEAEYPTYSTLPRNSTFKGRFEEPEFSRLLYAFIQASY